MENQTPEVVVPQQSKLNPMLWVVIGVAILAAGVGIGLAAGKYFQPVSSTTSVSTIIPSPNPFPTEIPVKESDPTANWKTYTSEKFGFSFRYPETWKDISDPKSATEFKIETTSNEVVLGTIFDGKADKAKDKSWIRNLDLINNKSILISYMQCAGMGCKEGSKDIAIFDQILSTFKFMKEEVSTDPETHKSWTTYTDKDAKFLIQYPQGWTLRKTYGASVNNTANYRVSGVDISTNLSTGSTVVVNIIDPKNETFENWVKLHSGETNVPNAVNSSYKNIPAYRFERFREGRPAEVVTYYALPNNLIVFLALNPSLADQAVGELILSSFKFTN